MMSLTKANVHSKKGDNKMNWMRKNSFISMVVIFSIAVIVMAFMSNEEVEQTETIYVSYGETLWSLADQYRGKMAKHDWIQYVEKLNHLESEKIVAGAVIDIPVIENSDYLQRIQQEQQHVKVARNNE
jgi:hypothetical protein